MPTLYRPETNENYQKKVKEGRGFGEGADYKPWIRTNEFPSLGLSSATYSHKTGRVMHLFSRGENSFWSIAEHSPHVVDIREQYPLLSYEEVLKLAEENNIPYPNIANQEHIMTTDFLLTINKNKQTTYRAISFKYSKPRVSNNKSNNNLEDIRVLEKLEIERIFWKKRGIDWKIITDQDISPIVVKNLNTFYQHYELDKALTAEVVNETAKWLKREVLKENEPLRKITSRCDIFFGFPEAGTSLSIVWHLLAHRNWTVDLFTPVDPSKILILKYPRK
jgi:hypothetical protein